MSIITFWSLFFLLFSQSSRHVPTSPKTLYPPSEIDHSVLSRWNNGYGEKRFFYVLEKLNEVYGPVIGDLGGELVLHTDWTDGAVNMWAERWGDRYILEIPGGFARYHLINEEAFLLTICHELGHLLGGPPQTGVISLEGQSDYFSTGECSRKLFEAVLPQTKKQPSPQELEFCKGAVGESSDVCHRHTAGMLSVTSWFAEIAGLAPPRLDTPDSSQVSKTLEAHPKPQCRLDTLVAGYLRQSRPKCWYKH